MHANPSITQPCSMQSQLHEHRQEMNLRRMRCGPEGCSVGLAVSGRDASCMFRLLMRTVRALRTRFVPHTDTRRCTPARPPVTTPVPISAISSRSAVAAATDSYSPSHGGDWQPSVASIQLEGGEVGWSPPPIKIPWREYLFRSLKVLAFLYSHMTWTL